MGDHPRAWHEAAPVRARIRIWQVALWVSARAARRSPLCSARYLYDLAEGFSASRVTMLCARGAPEVW